MTTPPSPYEPVGFSTAATDPALQALQAEVAALQQRIAALEEAFRTGTIPLPSSST